MELFYTLLGLYAMVSQVRGAVILFGGHKNAPSWLKVVIGVGLGLMLIAVIEMAK